MRTGASEESEQCSAPPASLARGGLTFVSLTPCLCVCWQQQQRSEYRCVLVGVRDIALVQHVAFSAFFSFRPFCALVSTSPIVFLLSSCFSLDASLGCGQDFCCWVWGRVAGVWGGCALQTAPLASPACGGLSHTSAQSSPAAASQLEESAAAVLIGLPAFSTLVALASPPYHLACAASPALVACPACDSGPWSVALVFVILPSRCALRWLPIVLIPSERVCVLPALVGA